jgi:hypothetical protein
MRGIQMKLTIYHDGQYWVGVVEEQDQGKLKAARYIFGTEPKDEEIRKTSWTLIKPPSLYAIVTHCFISTYVKICVTHKGHPTGCPLNCLIEIVIR